ASRISIIMMVFPSEKREGAGHPSPVLHEFSLPMRIARMNNSKRIMTTLLSEEEGDGHIPSRTSSRLSLPQVKAEECTDDGDCSAGHGEEYLPRIRTADLALQLRSSWQRELHVHGGVPRCLVVLWHLHERVTDGARQGQPCVLFGGLQHRVAGAAR